MSTGVEITTKERHYIVSNGFYSIIRHPYYFLQFFTSSIFFLISGNWFIAIAFASQHYFLISRFKEEEQYLITELGEAYVAYMQQVPNAFNPIPGLRNILLKIISDYKTQSPVFIPLQTFDEKEDNNDV